MRIVLKTGIQKISFFAILLAIISILLLVFEKYIFGFIGVISIIGLLVVFFRLLPEELVIYALKQNSGRVAQKDLFSQLPTKAEMATLRLIKKGIVEVEGDYVLLINPGELSAFEERKK